jgi:DNA-binding transcriptional ArsR family regulator
VLRLDFEIEDVASVRFAISPVAEAVGALRVLGDVRSRPHPAWLNGLGRLRRDGPLDLLLDLVAPEGYLPDFLTPPLTTPMGEFATELATIRATPPEVVRHELDLTFTDRTMPARIRALHADPAARLADLVDALARWHALAIAPHWERLRTVLTAEVARQSRRLADGGPELALRNLHPSIRWQPGYLTVEMRWAARFRLGGKGLLLVPSAFWQGVGPIVLGSWQPTLLYPASGVELMWLTERIAPNALAAVLGATRARLLTELEQPATTSQLARRLGLAAPGVSQHLKRLRNAGLVTADRDGREVRYRRTPLATELIHAATNELLQYLDDQHQLPIDRF